MANGPPRLDPAISPNVAAAIATLLAPVCPSSSTIGAIAAAVPCPPVIAVEPVNKAINGSIPVAYPIPTATIFCNTTKIIATIKNIITFLPPTFNNLQLALKPILVKNNVIKKLCKVLSNSKITKFICLKIKFIIANKNPPITGDGIQYVSKNLTFLLSNLPIIKITTASPTVCIISIFILNILSSFLYLCYIF